MYLRPILAVAAVAAAFVTTGFAVTPAVAQTTEAVAVSYQDLNLGSRAGRAALDGRIALAARQVCGESSFELKLAALGRSCRDEAIASAQAQVDDVVGRRGTVRVSMAAN